LATLETLFKGKQMHRQHTALAPSEQQRKGLGLGAAEAALTEPEPLTMTRLDSNERPLNGGRPCGKEHTS